MPPTYVISPTSIHVNLTWQVMGFFAGTRFILRNFKKPVCTFFSLTTLFLTTLSMRGCGLSCRYYLGYFFSLASQHEFQSPYFFEKLVNVIDQVRIQHFFKHRTCKTYHCVFTSMPTIHAECKVRGQAPDERGVSKQGVHPSWVCHAWGFKSPTDFLWENVQCFYLCINFWL